MCKSEIFAEILNVVGKETEVSTELILSSSKVTEVVDARSIVVFFLAEYGLYPEQIATLLHKTSASIRYLISTFESRKLANKMIAIYLPRKVVVLADSSCNYCKGYIFVCIIDIVT